MSVSLAKGGTVSLSKEAGPVRLTAVLVGLGWDPIDVPGVEFDLDASALILGADGRVLSDSDFVFYGNLASSTAAVTHLGDNRTGEGDGDDEQLLVDLDRLPPAALSVVFAVTIHEAAAYNLSFGQVSNAFIRVENKLNGVELARFDLTDGASTDDALVFGELFRDGAEWRFRAIGDGAAGGLAGIARSHGVNVG